MSNLHIPIAVSRLTHELVNAKDVPNGLNCDCFCTMCKENLIAVNQEIKQRAHFRHSKNSSCDFNTNYESYIHWLTKEVFKKIMTISLPPIRSNDLQNDYRVKLHEGTTIQLEEDNNYIAGNGPFDEIDDFIRFSPRNILLQNISKIDIEECITEKVYKSKKGEIRVDIVAFVGGTEFFIEPFYLNKIDDEKLLRIMDLNVSTISIDLLKFVDNHDFLFTVEELSDYLMNDLNSKKWIFIRDSKAKNLISNFFKKVWPKQEKEIKDLIKNNAVLENKIANNLKKIYQLEKENAKFRNEIKEIDIDEILYKKHWL